MLSWSFTALEWVFVASGVGGLAALALFRPWRFFQLRRHCPQCKQLLARWDWWGWRDQWTCPRCGCQVGR